MMSYWFVVEPYWDRCPTDDPAAFLRYYASMPSVARDLLTTHWVYSEVCNGGFHQLFTNPTGVLVPEAIVGFQAMNATELADIASEACSFFGEPYPRPQMARIEALERHADRSDPDSWNPFESADDSFYAALDREDGSDAYISRADVYAQGGTT